MLIITTTTTTENNSKPLSYFLQFTFLLLVLVKRPVVGTTQLSNKKEYSLPFFCSFLFLLVLPPLVFLAFCFFCISPFLWVVSDIWLFFVSLFFFSHGLWAWTNPSINRFRKRLTTTSSIAAAAAAKKIWHVDEEYNRLRERDRGIFPQLQKERKKGKQTKKIQCLAVVGERTKNKGEKDGGRRGGVSKKRWKEFFFKHEKWGICWIIESAWW